MKKKTDQTQTATATTGAALPPPQRKTRQSAVIQADLAVEIESCKKRISSLKALNKLTPIIEGMDLNALTGLESLVLRAKKKFASE